MKAYLWGVLLVVAGCGHSGGSATHASAAYEDDDQLLEFAPAPSAASAQPAYADTSKDADTSESYEDHASVTERATAEETSTDAEASVEESAEELTAAEPAGGEYRALGRVSDDPLGGLSDREVLGGAAAAPAAPSEEPEEVAEAADAPQAPGALTVRPKGNKKSKKACLVTVNGERFGKAPVINAEIDPGRHRVVVKCKKKTAYDAFVEVESGREEIVTFNSKAAKQKRRRR